VNIEYIYERVSNPTSKKKLFSWKHRIYILKGFKSHIEKIKHFSNIYIVNFKSVNNQQKKYKKRGV
jgi:hypothetical protein